MAALFVWLLACGLLTMRRTAVTVRHLRPSDTNSAPTPALSVCVIVPCKNAGHDLATKMERLLAQAWNDYRVIFVTGASSDPAHPILKSLVASRQHAMLLESGVATHSGQKVHNLVRGLKECHSADVVLIADSDGDYPASWIASMTQPFADLSVGATLGAPWFLPETLTIWSRALSWSLNTQSLLYIACPDPMAGWGGSMGFRSSALREAHIDDLWTRVVYDDVTAVTALRRAGIQRVFVGPVIPSFFPGRTFLECVRWFTRQLIATRVYAPSVFRDGLAVQFPLMIAALAGPILVGVSLWHRSFAIAAAVAVGASALRFVLGARIVRAAGYKMSISHLWLGYVGAVLSAVAGTWASGSRRFTWAGMTYELVSERETKII